MLTTTSNIPKHIGKALEDISKPWRGGLSTELPSNAEHLVGVPYEGPANKPPPLLQRMERVSIRALCRRSNNGSTEGLL